MQEGFCGDPSSVMPWPSTIWPLHCRGLLRGTVFIGFCDHRILWLIAFCDSFANSRFTCDCNIAHRILWLIGILRLFSPWPMVVTISDPYCTTNQFQTLRPDKVAELLSDWLHWPPACPDCVKRGGWEINRQKEGMEYKKAPFPSMLKVDLDFGAGPTGFDSGN